VGETSRRQNRGHLLRERVSSNCDNETGFTSPWVSDYHHLTPRSHARWTITSCHLLLPPASHWSLHFHFPLKKKPNKISRPNLLLRVQNSSQHLDAGGQRERGRDLPRQLPETDREDLASRLCSRARLPSSVVDTAPNPNGSTGATRSSAGSKSKGPFFCSPFFSIKKLIQLSVKSSPVWSPVWSPPWVPGFW
jgi:hypothetical protein